MKNVQNNSNITTTFQPTQLLYLFLAIGICYLVTLHPALASTDVLDADLDKNVIATVKKIGRICALTSIGVGSIVSVAKFNPWIFGGSVGVALASLYGPGAVTGYFAALI